MLGTAVYLPGTPIDFRPMAWPKPLLLTVRDYTGLLGGLGDSDPSGMDSFTAE